jgi:hypothetical protein
VEARCRVYRPTDEWILDHKVYPCLIEEFVGQELRGVPQYFHDLGDNGDINRLGSARVGHDKARARR